MIDIVYLYSTLRRTGPTSQLYYLLRHLDRSRFNPRILTISPEPENSDFSRFKELDIIIECLGLKRKSIFYSLTKRKNRLLENSFHIVQSYGLRADMFSVNYFAKENSVNITTVRNDIHYDSINNNHGLINKLITRIYMNNVKRMDYIVACSRTISRVLRGYGVSSLTINNGVDVESFLPLSREEKSKMRRKLDIPNDKLVMIFTGRVIRSKDIHTLIRGFKRSRISNRSILLILGDGDDLGRCILEANNDDSIRFLRFRKNVKEYLQVSDLYVSASKTEGMPNSVLEALSCGLPVCLSEIDQHKEVIELDRKAGFLFTRGSTESFAEELDRVGNQDLEVMSRHARSLAEKEFSAKEMSLRYQRTYEKLLEKFPR
nr:glycosyltransferase family 4 protein [Mesotoga sp. UBA5557]